MAQEGVSFLDIFRSVGIWPLKLFKCFDHLVGSLITWFLISKKPGEEIKLDQIKQILIVRPGGIGDAVFLLPFLRKLKEDKRDLKIDILCEKRNREVFNSQRGVFDNLYCYDQLSSFLELWKNQYDVIMDTEQWHYLSAITAFFLPSSHKIGFATRPKRSKLFTHRIDYKQSDHELESFKHLFRIVSLDVDKINDIENSFEVSEELDRWAKAKISSNTVSLFLGSSIVIRRLTVGQCKEIIDQLLNKNLNVVLLGGQDVVETGLALENHFRGKSILNFVGKCNLIQSAAIIKNTKLFIGPDSGLMHLACAVATPVVAIFGPGNLEKWRPKGSKHRIISEYVSCSPCTRFGYTLPTCHGSFLCMRQIKISKIEWLSHSEF